MTANKVLLFVVLSHAVAWRAEMHGLVAEAQHGHAVPAEFPDGCYGKDMAADQGLLWSVHGFPAEVSDWYCQPIRVTEGATIGCRRAIWRRPQQKAR